MHIESARNDKREIRILFFENNPPITVGDHGVTKIVAYGETGHMAEILWFAVYEGEIMAGRVNGNFVRSISYKPI